MEKVNNIIIQAEGITKHFGGICALDHVDLELINGEILGLVGDNGAGKSTLIKIISGVLPKDSGEIYFEGKEVDIKSPKDAKNLGIETVYQDLALVNTLNVPANIFLSREVIYDNILGKVFRFMNHKKMYKESEQLIKKLGIDIGDLARPMIEYSGGQRQAVAISKIVYWGKKVAILDEPTAALGVREARIALDLIKMLKEHGLSVLIISHNLQHIFSIVDRIMVLRRGMRVGVKNAREVDPDEIVSMITGVDKSNVI
jgi:fructose transport system ATP-binding protein